MTVNVGLADRVVRVALGLVLIAAPFVTGWPLFDNSLWRVGAVVAGLGLVATGAARFCPAYRLFNLNTCRSGRND